VVYYNTLYTARGRPCVIYTGIGSVLRTSSGAVSKNKAINLVTPRSFLPCKSSIHTDGPCNIHPLAQWMFGHPICHVCWKILIDQTHRVWLPINRSFEAGFQRDVLDKWQHRPMQHILRGLAIVLLGGDHTPLRLTEYAAIGYGAMWEPLRTMMLCKHARGANTVSVAETYSPTVWNVVYKLCAAKFNNFL
jgi:hypothetical protein